ncbi:Gfo/Idh/MocA family protein [Aureimonas pseudogalii]|uniref:Putative dehydrogenase n=1 Tax=Aureimonas pseudogalii TaxID=1744844 RepID=A0A7W6H5J6_9HYPH|nr:Gfo/Idh/MocA family oxidoreductase [Aureimonas pseudogalii]MBB3998962.1 putative dehydrogenase [Aureimonas pseudogalii]
MTKRLAVVGCGQWGQNHVRTLREIGALAAICDADPARAAPLAERFAVPARALDDVLADRAIDGLVLAMPPRLHGPTARRAFAAGKDVLIEKPIGLDPADAEETARAAAEHGRLLMVGHVLRFHPVFERLDAAVREGAVGEVRHIASTRLGLGRFLGMDVVWDLAPHDLSLVLHVAGAAPERIETLRRTVLSNETDAADIAMTFPGGVTAEIHVSRISPYRDRRFSVVGTEGMITFDDLAPEGRKLALYAHQVRRADAGFTFRHADPEYLETEPGLPLDRELRHFLHCIETRESPRTGAAEAVETVRILAAASPRRAD